MASAPRSTLKKRLTVETFIEVKGIHWRRILSRGGYWLVAHKQWASLKVPLIVICCVPTFTGIYWNKQRPAVSPARLR